MKAILTFGETGNFFSLFIFLGICLLIFLAIRSIVLWYWKINAIVENQEKQLDALNSILQKLDAIESTKKLQ